MQARKREREKEKEEELLTIKEVAELLAVSEVTVHRFKKEAGLPYIKIGNALRFDRRDLWAWIEAHKRNKHKRNDHKKRRDELAGS